MEMPSVVLDPSSLTEMKCLGVVFLMNTALCLYALHEGLSPRVLFCPRTAQPKIRLSFSVAGEVHCECLFHLLLRWRFPECLVP